MSFCIPPSLAIHHGQHSEWREFRGMDPSTSKSSMVILGLAFSTQYFSQGCVGKSGRAVKAGACRGLVLGCDNRQSPSAVSKKYTVSAAIDCQRQGTQ